MGRMLCWALVCLCSSSMVGCRTASDASQVNEAASLSPPDAVLAATETAQPEQGLGGLVAMDGMFAVDSEDDSPPIAYRLKLEFRSETSVFLSFSVARHGVWVPQEEQVALLVTALRCPGCYQFDGQGQFGSIQVTALYLPTGFAGTPPTQVSIVYGSDESQSVTDLRFERLATGDAAADLPAGLTALGGMTGGFTLAGLGVSPAAGGVSRGEEYSLYLRFESSSEASLDISYNDERGYAERQVAMRVIAARCPGCFDFVGDGNLGAIRIRTMYLPVAPGGFSMPPIKVEINFRGYANLPVTRIGFDRN